MAVFAAGYMLARSRKRDMRYTGMCLVGASAIVEGLLLIANDAFVTKNSDEVASAILLIFVGTLTCAFARSMLTEVVDKSEGDEYGPWIHVVAIGLYATGILFLYRVPAIGLTIENIPAMFMLATYGITLCVFAIQGYRELRHSI